jgi:hypothetical protein
VSTVPRIPLTSQSQAAWWRLISWTTEDGYAGETADLRAKLTCLFDLPQTLKGAP